LFVLCSPIIHPLCQNKQQITTKEKFISLTHKNEKQSKRFEHFNARNGALLQQMLQSVRVFVIGRQLCQQFLSFLVLNTSSGIE
jgi:hypothetical protein